MLTCKGMEVPYPIFFLQRLKRTNLINSKCKKQNNYYYNIVLRIAAK